MSDRGRAFSFAVRFYLGLGAPAASRRYPDCSVRAASGYAPDLVHALLHLYLGETDPELGAAERINYRSARVALRETGQTYFLKEFPRLRAAHDLERALRLSRADRAWRAAHLLPRLGISTPAAVGMAQRREATGAVTEYLVTEWLEGTSPFAEALPPKGDRRGEMLQEMAAQLRLCHRQGVYSRDFVKNVLVQEAGGARRYWLIDLDGIHPLRRVTRRRVLFHLRELAYYCPLSEAEVRLVCQAYLGPADTPWAQALLAALREGRA